MNDRYLYRAKRTDNGEWVEGYIVVYPSGRCDINKKCTEPPDVLAIYEIDPSSICQCTGRNDEWEHDIFQCDDERYEIQFSEDSLTWEAVSIFSPESISLGEFNPSEYVRIGNAIDNPELLEVSNG